MDVFTLVGKITLDGAEKVKEGLSSIESYIEKNKTAFRTLGIVMTGVGATGLAMVSSSRDLKASLSQVGITLGVTTGEMKKLALSTTDVSFPLKEVADTFTYLASAGVRNTQLLKDTALAFDALADAIGSNATEVAQILVPAYKNFGMELPTIANDLDNITWLAKNTTVTLDDFGQAMTFVAVYGKNLHLSMNQLVAVLGILESRGVSGSAATRTLRNAINDAGGSVNQFYRLLGTSRKEVATYEQSIGSATGSTQRYADAALNQYGIMDRVKQKWGETTLAASGFLEPLEPIFAALTALGPVMIFLSTSIGTQLVNALFSGITALIAFAGKALAAAGAAIIQAVASVWSWAASLPYGLGIALGIGAVAAIGASIWGAMQLADRIKGMAEGGLITEPTLLVGLKSHRPYAVAGEAGTEAVVPLGKTGMGTVNFNIDIASLVVREEADIERIAKELYRLSVLRLKNV